MRSPRLLLALAMAVALVAGACGGGTESPSTSAAVTQGGTDGAGIVLPTTDGGQLAFNDLEGKPALLWFWAPW